MHKRSCKKNIRDYEDVYDDLSDIQKAGFCQGKTQDSTSSLSGIIPILRIIDTELSAN